MILTILSILITILCLAAILTIVVRHWNALSSIDIEALPQTRDARTKKRIMSDRLRRQLHVVTWTLRTRAEPLSRVVRERITLAWNVFWDWLEAYTRRRQSREGNAEEDVSPSRRIERALSEAGRLFDDEEYVEAEKRYIDGIACDAKNLDAYKGLSRVYIRQKEWASAQEVLEFLTTHLREASKKESAHPAEQSMCEMQLAEALEELAGVYRMRDNMERAEQIMHEAVELQPQNPKFLDAMLEMYILLGKKQEASAALSRLRDANPENQKLSEFEDRIGNI